MSTIHPALAGLAGFIIIGILALIGLSISAAFLLWAARLVHVEKRSFGRALATILIGGIASFLFSMLFNFVPIIAPVRSSDRVCHFLIGDDGHF